MTTPQTRLLDCYERIASATHDMLEAARAADWPALDRSEHTCRTWIAYVERMGDPHAVLDAQGRHRRMEILRGVLRDDAEIRNLLEPCLGRVDRWLGRGGARAAER
jgi:flagellar protein FliT